MRESSVVPRVCTAIAGTVALSLSLAANAVEPTATVAEFYNAGINQYFLTVSNGPEAALLDNGTISGWTRTGVSFSAWANAADSPSTVPVCRFVSTVAPQHFYTANAVECAAVAKDPSWAYEGTAFYTELPADSGCRRGTAAVYRTWYSAPIWWQGGHRYFPDLNVAERAAPTSTVEGVAMCQPLSTTQLRADSTRLLEQSTFGPNDALVAHVMAVGTQAFLNEQFAAASARYPSIQWVPAGASATFCPTDPNPQCPRDYYTLFLLQNAFFKDAITSSDQLRQRVAFALSQILVTSGTDIALGYAMAPYQQIFRDTAFGNLEDILTKVTLSPVMGDYLDMVNNDKPSGVAQPNENYARELMQLFSIGVWELNLDGTLLRDATGAPIPTYDQDTVEGFAHVFTGWTYPLISGNTQRTHNPRNYLGNMVPVASNHDTGNKELLEEVVLAAGGTITGDLTNAIHNVFMHPNVGPFISKQLIQKLVTGDPTPQYVARVASVFNNNGAAVRGDMRAVVNAILTDPDARGDVKYDLAYGKLREPALFVAGLARAANAATDGVFFVGQASAMGQNVFYPPSVFNYYPPGYVLPGTQSVAPEFALQNASTAINRYNFANTVSFGTIAPLASLPGATGTQPDWSALQALAGNPTALLDKLDQLLMHGTLTAEMRNAILPAITAVSASDTLTRARTAFYLVTTSSQYQVER